MFEDYIIMHGVYNMHCMQAACWSCTERLCSLSWTSLRLTTQSMLSLMRSMGQCRLQQKRFESYVLQPDGFSSGWAP